MKIGYGEISGDIYLILGPGRNTSRSQTLRLKDLHNFPNTALVDIRDFTINDLLIISSNVTFFEDKIIILKAIKELVQN